MPRRLGSLDEAGDALEGATRNVTHFFCNSEDNADRPVTYRETRAEREREMGTVASSTTSAAHQAVKRVSSSCSVMSAEETRMKKLLIGSVALAVGLLSVLPQAHAHDYGELKAGNWRQTGDPQCEGYNLNLYRYQVEQNQEHQPDAYRFSQSGHRVVATGLKLGRPRLAVLGEVSEDYVHFEILESSSRGTVLSVWSVEILEDEEELEYTYWTTAHYADAALLHCTGIWIGSTCSGDEYVTGVPNFSEGYKRYSVKCTGALEWVGD